MAEALGLQLIFTLVVLRKLFTLFLTFVGPWIVNIFAQYNQQDAMFHNLFISVRTCFRRGFPSIIRSSKLHIQRQVFVRPLLLHGASLARLTAGSSNGLTNTWRCMCSFELLMLDGKTRLKHVQRLTEINKMWNLDFVGCILGIQKVIFELSKQGCKKSKIKTNTEMIYK